MGYVCNQGCTIQITNGTGDVNITTPASTSVKVGGKGAYSGPLTISITGFVGSIITGGAGTGTLSPNAQFSKIDGKLAVLENATASIVCYGTNAQTGATGFPETANVKIISAGQKEVSLT